jgi:hypothetical protein
MERGVVVVDCAEKIADRNIDGEFFFQFASESLLRCFAGLHFAARKFPSVFEIAITALSREDLVAVFDDACYNFDMFHD